MAKKTTPMMIQYNGLRKTLPDDVILFFRLGDFYEIFMEDAKRAAPVLDVALTKRNGMPMCGVPHHAAEGYIGKLVKKGLRVAVAEQTTTPRPGQIVERAISQVISAGTIADLNLLEPQRANYLAAVCPGTGRKSAPFGLAYADHTTGEFRVAEFADAGALEDELARVAPSEILIPDDALEVLAADSSCKSKAVEYDSYTFSSDQAQHLLTEHFGVRSLEGFGCAEMTTALGAAGAVLHYLKFSLHRKVAHLTRLHPSFAEKHVLIDASSQRNLDLVESRGGVSHTLLKALDRTATPMGARLLRHWILHPLRDLAVLQSRQSTIGALLQDPYLHSQIQESLSGVRDIERTSGRLSQGGGNARDLQSLARSLARVPEIRDHLSSLRTGDDQENSLLQDLHLFPELVASLDSAIADEPPANLRDGGIFREGYHSGLDELRAASKEGKKWIADLQAREAEATGIKSLKIKYTSVFGYFIEVTKANVPQVPDSYTRKQTTANAERYFTAELKETEDKILGADERSRALEIELFQDLRQSVLEHLVQLQETAAAIAQADVLCGLAETARLFSYAKPELNNSRRLTINEGRHPVLDQNIGDEKFVPNDTLLEPDENRLALITGPNMAGKSTYIRQVALITLMAQIGSWVPAASAEIGLVDRIFTRVGANDDLAKGQSTFMVEMNETALIINNATDRSLVILDEIGRGTSTFDGLSIAWSVAEHLHDEIGCRTLFATHYHEITALARTRPAVQNYNVAVREWNDEIIFLRTILAGTADKSYGIQVARLAGLPADVISRAKAILNNLEENSLAPGKPSKTPKKRTTAKPPASGKIAEAEMPVSPAPQLTLFD